MVKNRKCLVTGKTCKETDPDCPEYQNSNYCVNAKEITENGNPIIECSNIVLESECRYRGVMRYQKIKHRKFLDKSKHTYY